jgi:hypothetical protein
MIEIDPKVSLAIENFVGGMVIGLIMVGILFYIIKLTGEYTATMSVVYLTTNLGIIGLTAGEFMLEFLSPQAKIAGHFVTLIFSNSALGYFWVLIQNTLFMLTKLDLALIIVFPLPILIASYVYYISNITRFFGLEDGMNHNALMLVCAVGYTLVSFIANYVCYNRFKQYKVHPIMDPLVGQYLTGILIVLFIDICFVILAIVFNNVNLSVHCCSSIIMIGLNMEYFLLFRLRNQTLAIIETQNSSD